MATGRFTDAEGRVSKPELRENIVMRCLSSTEIAVTHEYPKGTRCEIWAATDETGPHYRWRLVNPRLPKHKLANTPFYLGKPETKNLNDIDFARAAASSRKQN